MSRLVHFDWKELESAFERNAPGTESYLCLETGEIWTIVEGRLDAAEYRARVAESPGGVVLIDPVPSREQYRWMETFVGSVADQALRERLLVAIDGKGAFRRFKDALLDCPGERERWFSFRSAMLRRRIHAWLEKQGIEPGTPPPWGSVGDAGQALEGPASVASSVPESPAEALRQKARRLLERLPAVELPAAVAFLEFLRDRGATALFDRGGAAEGGSDAGSSEPAAQSDIPDDQ